MHIKHNILLLALSTHTLRPSQSEREHNVAQDTAHTFYSGDHSRNIVYVYIIYMYACTYMVVRNDHMSMHIVEIHVHIYIRMRHTASFSFLKAVSSFTISLSFSNASVLYTYFPCTKYTVRMYIQYEH